MSFSFNQVMSDAKQLLSRLGDCENTCDRLVHEAIPVNKTFDTMRKYYEDGDSKKEIDAVTRRAILIQTIQRESRQLKQLQWENKQLRNALEDHQFALELSMKKYRQQVQLLREAKERCFQPQPITLSGHDEVLQQAEIIKDMAVIMQQAIKCDEKNEMSSFKDDELIKRLRNDNKILRDLLNRTINNFGEEDEHPFNKTDTENSEIKIVSSIE